MKNYFKHLLEQKGLQLSLLLIMLIVCANVILVIYYRNVMMKSSETSQQIQLVKEGLNVMDTNIRLADIGVKAYIIRQTSQFLNPYISAKQNYLSNLDTIEKNLLRIGYNIDNMVMARETIIGYMQDVQLIVDLCDQGKVDEALEIFYEDRGFTAWQRYDPFIQDANSFISDLNLKSRNDFKSSINLILIIQMLLIILSIPVLMLAYRKSIKDDRFRRRIFKLISSSNRNYLFNDGHETDENDEDSIAENLITNLQKAAKLINNISQGKFDIEWEGTNKETLALNQDNIVGELIKMKDQMQKAKKVDEIRIWTNEGLSKFADLIRTHQDNLQGLSDILISNIVEYLGAQQGGLFFLEEEEDQKFLKLVSCYAYQRKKYLNKRIELGQSMVGQCFLEGETTYVENLPQEYVNITSGLGDANPSSLLIVPLKMNEEVVGVIEIASLKSIEKHKIEFLERLAETIASSIATVKTNESTRLLLAQSQEQAEEMKAQEEEMRQNMEELQATQEQMYRKNEEVENLLKQASENEESMRLQMEALEELQEESIQNTKIIQQESDDFRNMLMDILNEVPQKIFLKDAEGKIYIANQKVADAHELPLTELIGKSDYDFVDKKTADEWRKQELEIMKKGEEKYVFEDIIGGKKTILESIKKVFNIRPINQVGLLGIQSDITEKVELRKKIESLEDKS